MKKIYWIVLISSLMAVVSCKEPAEKNKTAVSAPDTLEVVEPDTTLHIHKDVIRDYVPRVLKFKKMPDATREEQINKYEVFAACYIDYLLIIQNEKYYSDIEQKDNKQAFSILRDETISLKEKMTKNAATYTSEDIARLDAADARMNEVIEKNP